MIPLFKVDGHQLVSTDGHYSSFVKVTPPDMEGVTFSQKLSLLKKLETNLSSLQNTLKIFSINNELYFNYFGGDSPSGLNAQEAISPLEKFCGKNADEINFYENYLLSNNTYQRVISIKEFPNSIDLLDTTYWPDFVINIRKLSKIEAKNKINFKRRIHYSNLFKDMRDVDSENAYKEAEEILENITRGDKSLFDVEMFLIISAETKDSLDLKTDSFVEYLREIEAEVIVETRGLSYFYTTCLPGVKPSFKRSQLCPSDYLSYLVPFHSDYVHDKGFSLKSRMLKNVNFDLFQKNALNYNLLITGTSGQGKSVIANKILNEELKTGASGVVLDLGNSFYKTTRYNNGTVLSRKFNPMQFRNPKYLKEFILAGMDDALNKKDQGKLYECISRIISDGECKSFSVLLEHLEKDFAGIGFYFSELKEFFEEDFKELNKLTYCDFSNYPESMKAPLIIYLIEYFRNLKGKKIFIFDECWHLLKKNGDYIAECFRTFRKHNASAIAISQNLDDFSETQLGRVIIQNTFWKFLFKQNLSINEFVDEHSIDLLSGVQSEKGNFSEFLLLSETLKKIMRFYPSEIEYEIFTSDKNDNNSLEKYLEETQRYFGFKKSIINYTSLKYPRWEVDSEI
ncbi:MAG: hypothetical protein CME62_15015 [Halobacteriovoraceae bacterium]|nr:hypothetical protein [Halobacteriovoraceae bacterium]|tara:strand:- start:5951 stop:7828 length:1878 start_codon:yes stop_codon:yes gene_type:complete